jgi:hypothetical protein
MQRLRLDYMVGCLLDAVDQVVVPGAARSNVAGVPGVRLRGRWLWPFENSKILSRGFSQSSAGGCEEERLPRGNGAHLH